MRQMFQTMHSRLQAGEELVLVTVIAATGATPRGAGARMLVGRQGRICGTIGGGGVEHRAVQIAGTVLDEKTSVGHDFSLTRDDVQDLGMICGGAVEVFFHYIPAGDGQTMALAEEAERRFARSEDLWLVCDIGHGGAMSLADRGHPTLGAVLARHPVRRKDGGRDLYVEQIASSGKVYVFGGGHVAQELVPVLSHVGFRCVVMDDRPEFASAALFPDAERVVLGDFRKIDAYFRIGSEDYVCVMTRGHASDTVIQAQVLRCRPCYCGVIGSARKAAAVRQALREEYGLTDAELDLVTTPIGLPIKGETAAEIAISIAAQLILHRAERTDEKTGTNC